MSLTVAVQMDPLESINIAGDSTFAIMLGAQARGHKLWHYAAGELSYREGRLTAPAKAITVQRVAGDHFAVIEEKMLDLGEDVDVVLMRQDPPFDLAYITATHLLERIQHQTLVVNDPAAVRNAPEKLFVLDYAQFMPPTLITRGLEEARAFHAEHKEVVIKPLYGNAGSAVFFVSKGDANLAALTELFGQVWREPFMVQAFLPDVSKGDKRIILIDGKPAGAVNRLPKPGEIRSNLAVGGTGAQSELTERELEICEALGPELAKRGLLFVGIDVIAGHLTEINVTSPTGIVAIDRFNGTDTPALIWDAIEARLARR
ncbi:glutathione synthase [Sphingomonas sp. BIUV-7]|uniref:Glutathione synthetase n=1 Tax=Sphingomonas natans TaxID=3063330 RepID=A0ABT8YBP7_9SPHN|nr:glutathione synthase [Sphingomonas sp. BIUV-7]MDO6415745.1 glutathione synthase [Sphingomonas sp. BIUV-7]